jgi:hypothetical protein
VTPRGNRDSAPQPWPDNPAPPQGCGEPPHPGLGGAIVADRPYRGSGRRRRSSSIACRSAYSTISAISPFKSGLYHLCARRPGLELMPVHLDNLNRVLPKGEVVPVPLISRVTFGAPMRLGDAEDKPAFLERARAAVAELADE